MYKKISLILAKKADFLCIKDYLASVDAEANEMYESLIADFAKAEDVDENLKATDQMRWIQRMQSIANRAREIVEKEVIFR